MDCMIAGEDFEELCRKKVDAKRYAKDNQDKYRVMKDYSVESRVFDRGGDAAILFGMGFCLCKIGQYPLSEFETRAMGRRLL